MTYIPPSNIPGTPAPWTYPNPVQPTVIPTTTIINVPVTPTKVEFKPKRAGKNTAHVVFILDDSASMQSCRQQTIDGFNEFLQGQRESEILTYVSLYKFDGAHVTCVHNHVNVKAVPNLEPATYNPRGSTNLLDAMGDVMNIVNEQLKLKKKKDRDSVTLVILTDGEENSSQRFDNNKIKAMVEAAEGKDWGFFFLGANIDAFAVGSSLGFGVANTIQYSTANMSATMKSASRASNDMKVARSQGMDTVMAYATSGFTDKERDDVK